MRSIGQHLVDACRACIATRLTLTREPDAARDLMQQSALRRSPRGRLPVSLGRPAPTCSRSCATPDRPDPPFPHPQRGRSPRWPDEGFDDRLIEAIAVRQAFTALDTPCRSVVTCVDVEGLSYQETAERLGIPIGTVMSRLHRARRIMLHRIAGPSEGSEVS